MTSLPTLVALASLALPAGGMTWTWNADAKPSPAISRMRRDLDSIFLESYPQSADAQRLERIARDAWERTRQSRSRLDLATYLYATTLALLVNGAPDTPLRRLLEINARDATQYSVELHHPSDLEWNMVLLARLNYFDTFGVPASDRAFFRRHAKECLTQFKGEPVAEMLAMRVMYGASRYDEHLEVIKLAEHYERTYGWKTFGVFREVRCASLLGAAAEKPPHIALKTLLPGKELCEEYLASGLKSKFMTGFIEKSLIFRIKEAKGQS